MENVKKFKDFDIMFNNLLKMGVFSNFMSIEILYN